MGNVHLAPRSFVARLLQYIRYMYGTRAFGMNIVIEGGVPSWSLVLGLWSVATESLEHNRDSGTTFFWSLFHKKSHLSPGKPIFPFPSH
jgi:hypothetical protein